MSPTQRHDLDEADRLEQAAAHALAQGRAATAERLLARADEACARADELSVDAA